MKALPLALGLAFASGAHATPASSPNVAISMAVAAPSCTVTPSQTAIQLPSASSATQTVANWFTSNLQAPASGWYAPTNMNQTATISCNIGGTPILSFIVQPGSNKPATPAGTNGSGIAGMADTATTPVIVPNLSVAYHQVSVNGVAAPMEYINFGPNTTNANTTAFSTGPLSGGQSTAQVVWVPNFWANTSDTTSTIGTPTGGKYTTPAVINITY
ncbi:hypothetical protein [Burkholderia ubonensis]|uniref:hypothetical protein n=1 Tax=Burkholderia ubonensis TaxID=101571 RepID=UPI0012F97B8C|nr:hypothetical protein [Burkholderia ubonensis]